MPIIVFAFLVLTAANNILRPIAAHAQLKEDFMRASLGGLRVAMVGTYGVIGDPISIAGWKTLLEPEEIEEFDKARERWSMMQKVNPKKLQELLKEHDVFFR